MRALHFDPFAGASGDMILGALVDAGADAAGLESALRKALPFDLRLSTEKVVRGGLAGTRLEVAVDEGHPPRRGLTELLAILADADLPPRVDDGARRTFQLLAEAEASVHGTDIEKVHFHEVGAADCLIDVIGAHWLFHDMGIERTTSGPVPAGSGTAETAHGTLPVPAPATLKLLEGFPVSGLSIRGEAVTPTGAALLRTLTTEPWGEAIPPMTVVGSGYGFGTRRSTGPLPNALRVIVGELAQGESTAATDQQQETVAVLETTIDDMPGEWVGDIFEVLAEAGALEVSTTPVGAKKSRPAVRVTVLARLGEAEALAEILLRESTTFGVRIRTERRLTLERRTSVVGTQWGEVRVKVGMLRDEVVQVAPEYDDCRRLAREAGVALKTVYEAAVGAFRSNKS